MKTKIIIALLFASTSIRMNAQYFESAMYSGLPVRNVLDMEVSHSGTTVVAGYQRCGQACLDGFVGNFTFSSGGSSLSANVSRIAMDYAGNIYTLGNVGGFPASIGAKTANSNYFLFKLNTAGNVAWLIDNITGDVAADSMGNVYVTTNNFTRKYSTSGSITWTKATLQNARIAVDANKRVYISNADSTIKLDANGNTVYAKPYGGNLTVSRDGYVFIVKTDSLTKLGLLGNVAWRNTSAGGSSVVVDATKAAYVIKNNTIKKINTAGSQILWTLSADNTEFNLEGIDDNKNIYVAGNRNILSSTTLCPFYFEAYTGAILQGSTVTAKISQQVPMPFQAAIVTGKLYGVGSFDIDISNLTPLTIPFSTCFNNSSSFNPGNEFRVEMSNNNFFTNVTDIGPIGNAVIPVSVPEGDYRFRVVSTNPSTSYTYASTSDLTGINANIIHVWDKSVSISASGSTTICSGDSVKLSATYHAHGNYIWHKNTSTTVGSDSIFYAKQTGSYTCTYVPADPWYGFDSTSTPITITVKSKPPATITAQGPTTFCAGGSVTLVANSGTGLTYKWRKNNIAISGETNINYVATAAGNYSVKVTNANGCSRFSPGITVTVPCRESSLTETNSQTLITYPSPVPDILNIELPAWNTAAEIKIYNTTGQLVKSEKIVLSDEESKIGLDVKDLAGGLYSVIVGGNEKTAGGRFLKE